MVILLNKPNQRTYFPLSFSSCPYMTCSIYLLVGSCKFNFIVNHKFKNVCTNLVRASTMVLCGFIQQKLEQHADMGPTHCDPPTHATQKIECESGTTHLNTYGSLHILPHNLLPDSLTFLYYFLFFIVFVFNLIVSVYNHVHVAFHYTFEGCNAMRMV